MSDSKLLIAKKVWNIYEILAKLLQTLSSRLLNLGMIANQNAYEILGVGIITIEDLDKCGLSETSDILIKKLYLEVLEVHQTKIEGDASLITAEQITNAYSQIGNYTDRVAYNDLMKINGFPIEAASNIIKEAPGASAIRQSRQVSFNIDLKKLGDCEKTR